MVTGTMEKEQISSRPNKRSSMRKDTMPIILLRWIIIIVIAAIFCITFLKDQPYTVDDTVNNFGASITLLK